MARKKIALFRDRILLPVTLTLGEFKTIINIIISPATRDATRASIKTQREQLTEYFRKEIKNHGRLGEFRVMSVFLNMTVPYFLGALIYIAVAAPIVVAPVLPLEPLPEVICTGPWDTSWPNIIVTPKNFIIANRGFVPVILWNLLVILIHVAGVFFLGSTLAFSGFLLSSLFSYLLEWLNSHPHGTLGAIGLFFTVLSSFIQRTIYTCTN